MVIIPNTEFLYEINTELAYRIKTVPLWSQSLFMANIQKNSQNH